MQKWEYFATELFEEAKKIELPDIKDVLNKYGLDGWELVTVTAATLYSGSNAQTRSFAFFKRQKVIS